MGDTSQRATQRKSTWRAAVLGAALCAFTTNVTLASPVGVGQPPIPRSAGNDITLAQIDPVTAWVIVCVVETVCLTVTEYQLIKLCEKIVVKPAVPATATQPAVPAVTKEVCREVKKPVEKKVCKPQKVCKKQPKPK